MQEHKSQQLLQQAAVENMLLIWFYKKVNCIPAGPCHSPPWHLLSGRPSLPRLGFFWVVSLGEVKPAGFSEENEKHWIQPKKLTGTARSCRGAHILQHSFPAIIQSLLSAFGNEETQNWGGLIMETTQNIYRDGKYFLHFMCHQHEQLATTLLEHVHGGTLTLAQAGRKGVKLSKWVKWMPITPTTRNPARLRPLQSIWHQDLGQFPKEGIHVLHT